MRATFLSVLPEADRGGFTSVDLEGWLAGALAEARKQLADVGVPDDAFVRYLAEKVRTLSAPASCEKPHTTDLYLALACLRGDHRAYAHFEAAYFPRVERTLTRAGVARPTIEDVLGALREQLFFAQGPAKPLIADYSGRGDLGNWFRSIAMRHAFRAKQREARHVEADEALAIAAAANPEMEYVRQAHAELFERVLRRAIGGLSARERNLLRHHYLDGLTVDALGRLHQVHRATAARWVAQAREAVLGAVKSELAEHLSPSELESFLRATQQDLGLRLSMVLRASNTL